jgi:hypothetical protein
MRGAPRAGSTSITVPITAGGPARPPRAGSAVTGYLRTAWAAVADVQRTTPDTRTAQTVAQVKAVLRRLPASGAVPLFVFDAGYSAAALSDGLVGCSAHVLVRLPAGSVCYQDAPSWPGTNGRPAHRGPEVHSLEPEALAAAAGGRSPVS